MNPSYYHESQFNEPEKKAKIDPDKSGREMRRERRKLERKRGKF